MPDEITPQDPSVPEGEEDTIATDADTGTDDENPEGAEALGDPGKKALDAMKAERKSLKEQLRAARAELDQLKAPKPSSDGTPDLEAVRAEAERTATAKANERVVRAEIKAAAAGKLADPADAFRFLDASQFDVDENGNVDAEEVADAIEDLVKNKPYLGAATAKRFQGTGDGGAVRKPSRPEQLTREDLKRMRPAEIVKAKADGRLNDLLGVKD
jgi:hypothetical protein